MKTIIGLLACNKTEYAHRQTLCEETWAPPMRAAGIDVVYLVGGHGTTERIGNRLHLPVPDEYYDLPKKTKAFCQWLRDSDYTHAFKADDDSYIQSGRFVDWIEDQRAFDYVGNEWSSRTDYASGGAGYLLSRKSFELLANEMMVTLPRHRYEDVEVGKIMRKHNIKLHIDHRLIAFGNTGNRPLPSNDIITSHKISEELWRDSWAQVGVQ